MTTKRPSTPRLASQLFAPNYVRLAALAFGLVLQAHAVQAQVVADPGKSDLAPTPPRAKVVEELETVIVSSGKRSQKQRDVAGSVSALQGSELEATGARDQEDIFKMAPGVQVNKGDPNQSLPTIRGVGTVTNSAALGMQQGTTGIYIEDIPFTDPTTFIGNADLSPFDLSRVEVLRGPQGALFGSASLGGAVRYLVNKPNLKSQEFAIVGSAGAVAGGGTDYSLYAMANLPVQTDKSGLRVVAFDRSDSGYIRNLGTGKESANALTQRGGRVLGSLDLGRGAKVTAMLMTQTTDIDDGFAVSPNPSRLEIRTPTASSRSTQFSLGNIQLEVPFGNHTFTSNTGFIEKYANAVTDQTRRGSDIGPLLGLPPLPVISGASITKGRALSQEFRLASGDSGQFNYVGGVFYQKSEMDSTALWTAPGGAALWGEAVLPKNTLATEVDKGDTTETAVFADGEYRLNNGLSLGLGGRAYKNKSHFKADARFLEAVLGAVIVDQKFEESGLTPKASVKYRFGDQMWYALMSKGYRFGGVNAGNGTRFKSDSLWNYESGLRLTPARDVKLELTAFRLDWTDAQVNARQSGPVPLNGIANVGEVRITGLEVAANWQASKVLALSATVAYTDAATATPFTSNNGKVIAAGTPMPGTAKLQSFLQGAYFFSGPLNTSGKFSLAHSFTGSRTLSLDSGGTAPAYGQLESRMSFSGKNWELGLFVSNIADKRGINGGAPVSTFGGSSYTDYYLIKPRTAGMTLRYDL
jgi:iron complex outermembrane receptor protein